jgi:hypothetical protein
MDKRVLVLILGGFTALGLAGFIDYAIGSTDSHNLKVIFDSIKINNDHDIVSPWGHLGSTLGLEDERPGAWYLDAYVNEKRIPLSLGAGMAHVRDNDEIFFPRKNINLDVPDNGSVRIVTAGYDQDTEHIILPDLSKDLSDALPILGDRGINPGPIYNISRTLIAANKNDPLGVLIKEYDKEFNFGLGEHRECSTPNEVIIDLRQSQETSCDFVINYRIINTGFTPLTNTLPALSSSGPGQFDVLVLGKDRRLWHTTYESSRPNDFAPIHSLEFTPGTFVPSVTQPALTAGSPARLDAFAKGMDNAIWHNSYDRYSGKWKGWESLGGQFKSGPTAFSLGPTILSVFALDNNNKLRENVYDFNSKRWQGWKTDTLNVNFAFPPKFIVSEQGFRHGFGLTSDGSLWHGQYGFNNGKYQIEKSEYLGRGEFNSSPSIAVRNFGEIEMFISTSNGTLLYGTFSDNKLGDWESLGQITSAPEAISSLLSDRTDVFAINGTSIVQRTFY